jgi:hypothetical protein
MALAQGFLAELDRRALLLPGKDVLAFVDIDSWQKRVFGYHKQWAPFEFTKISGESLMVCGLNVLAAASSTPVTAAVRLRGGSAASVRGAASFVTETIRVRRGHQCDQVRLYQVFMHPCSRVVTFLSRRSFRFQRGRVFYQLGRPPERNHLRKLVPDICYTSASYLE